jgi:hypothetical protein
MTEPTEMINGACRSRTAIRELGRYGLDLALRTGTLRELFPDVLVRGGSESDPLTLISAAVLWCGDGVVCARSAAWLYGVPVSTSAVHLVRRERRNRRVPVGITVHGGAVRDDDIHELSGVPVFVPERIAADLLCLGDRGVAFALIDGAAERSEFVGAVMERLRDQRGPRGKVSAQRLLASTEESAWAG